MNDIVTYLNKRHIAYDTHVDLKKRTWIHRGGEAQLWIMPTSVEELESVCCILYKSHADFKLIGQTSNLYFKNEYNPITIVSTIRVANFEVIDDCILCDCGVPVKTLATYAVENGFCGFDGLVDLPGTIGAAICNNSGCYGCSVSTLLQKAEVLLPDGQIKTFAYDDFHYSERSSVFKRGEIRGIILRVYLKKQVTLDKTALQELAAKNHQHRQNYQEKPAHTLGSIFPMATYTAFEKHLSMGTKGLIYALCILYKCHIISHLCYTRSKRDIILMCNGLWSIRKYISEYTFNCFIWKDAHADEAFVAYKHFVLGLAGTKNIEIEIIN